jgi:hypothetical protein
LLYKLILLSVLRNDLLVTGGLRLGLTNRLSDPVGPRLLCRGVLTYGVLGLPLVDAGDLLSCIRRDSAVRLRGGVLSNGLCYRLFTPSQSIGLKLLLKVLGGVSGGLGELWASWSSVRPFRDRSRSGRDASGIEDRA